ncbi:MAG: hypothetical protein R2681_16345 [Pyrinomonadaceae bacterium]
MHENKDNKSSHLQVWFCQHCNAVHFRAANITLDFTRSEFLALSDAMLGILREDFTSEYHSRIEGSVDTDEVLFSETIG